MNSSLSSHFTFERSATRAVKGVALIMMFTLHFFAKPEFLIDYRYPSMTFFTSIFSAPLNGCVSIFAFLTGYFYSQTDKKTLKYSIKKISDLWVNYIIIFFILLIISIILGCYKFDFRAFLLEFFGIRCYQVYFGWYVVFYFATMLVLPIFSNITKKHILLEIVFGILLPFVLFYIFKKLTGSEEVWKIEWFAVVASGYIFGRHKLFEKIFDKCFRSSFNNIVFLLINIVMFTIAFMGRLILPNINYVLNFSTDALFAPLLVYSLVNIINLIPDKLKGILLPINLLGDYSLLMWFLHSVFFNSCALYTQKILYFPQIPFLVLYSTD